MTRGFWLTHAALEKLAAELNAWGAGARVQKCRQVSAHTVVIELHSRGETQSLLLQAQEPLLACLIASRIPSPAGQPPPFQGLMRKHLSPARLEKVHLDADHARAWLELHTPQTTKLLIFEWSARAANVILVDHKGTVLGAAHPPSLQPRGLRVGKPYVPPPAQPPVDAVIPDIPIPPDDPLHAFPTHAAVQIAIAGASPVTAQKAVTPQRRRVKAELDKITRLIKALAGDVERSDQSLVLRDAAERAKAQLHDLPRGVASWTLSSPFDPSAEPVTVKVDAAKTPLHNMERLFHQARRLENTRRLVTPRLEAARARKEQLAQLLQQLDTSPPDADELVSKVLGTPRTSSEAPRKGPSRRQPLRAFVTSGGMRVLCGKTPADNELLTHRLARGNDIFLHARDSPGAHVVLVVEGRTEPPDNAIQEAALIAAHFSQARDQSAVDVRYTEVKHVKRVSGHVGLVTLAKERVKRVRLDDARLREMLAQQVGADAR